MARKLTKTVLYYNRGSKCCLRLIASLYSLRKVYNDNVLLVLEGEQPKWFLNSIKMVSPDNTEIKEVKDSQSRNTLNVKSSLWRHSDYDLTMFMDSDTIVLRNIDSYFDLIKQGGFVTGKFADWKSSGSRIKNRINQWSVVLDREYLDKAISYGDAINTGINGWRKNDPFLERWEKMCALGAPHKCSDRVADEMAAQLLLHCNKHILAGVEWGTSVKYGIDSKHTKIIHYHGQKHLEHFPLCKYWKRAYRDLVSLGILLPKTTYNDRRIGSYLGLHKSTYPLTNVTAVNERYLNRFLTHMPQWMETNYFKEHPFIVFAHYDCISRVFTTCKKYTNIKVIPIDTNKSAETTREYMLSTFVFDVARHVKTKYWAKVDCDANIADEVEDIVLPKEVFKATISGHRCNYTRSKSDPEYDKTNEHWLHKLDRICNGIEDFKGTEPLFNGVEVDGSRISHKRTASFFCIEKTNFTKHVASICRSQHYDSDKMLIPSQDTLGWYICTRLGKGRTAVRMNMKRYFKL